MECEILHIANENENYAESSIYLSEGMNCCERMTVSKSMESSSWWCDDCDTCGVCGCTGPGG